MQKGSDCKQISAETFNTLYCPCGLWNACKSSGAVPCGYGSKYLGIFIYPKNGRSNIKHGQFWSPVVTSSLLSILSSWGWKWCHCWREHHGLSLANSKRCWSQVCRFGHGFSSSKAQRKPSFTPQLVAWKSLEVQKKLQGVSWSSWKCPRKGSVAPPKMAKTVFQEAEGHLRDPEI